MRRNYRLAASNQSPDAAGVQGADSAVAKTAHDNHKPKSTCCGQIILDQLNATTAVGYPVHR